MEYSVKGKFLLEFLLFLYFLIVVRRVSKDGTKLSSIVNNTNYGI